MLKTRVTSWLQAARPLAAANIAPPLILGQTWAFAQTGVFSWTLFGFIQVFGVLDHLFIVFANDVADHKSDLLNENPTLFSGGSRVLVEQLLSPGNLAMGALTMAMLMTALCLILALFFARPWSLLFVGAAVFLLWAYSYPPLRLSYRGQGEWLQGIGMGVVLPTFGFYIQSGELTAPLWGLCATTLLGTSGNIVTALPDESADRQVDKHTPVVRWGRKRAIWVCAILNGVASGIVIHAFVESSGVIYILWGFVCVSLLSPVIDIAKNPLRFVWTQGVLSQLLFVVWVALILLD